MLRIVPRVCGRHARSHLPQHCSVTPGRQMSHSVKRQVPLTWSPWGRRNTWPWDDPYFSSLKKRWPFDKIHHFREMMQHMERVMSPRNFDSYYRPRDVVEEVSKSEVTKMKYDDKIFEVKLDVQLYSPEELHVKITDNRLVISGKQEQRADEHGYVSREFVREFNIPEDVDPETISSLLTEEGKLVVKGRVKGAEDAHERVITIEKEPAAHNQEKEQSSRSE